MKRIIRRLVDLSAKIALAMETAYGMTYRDSETAKDFYRELEKRKEDNKNKFIEKGAIMIARETLHHEGWLMPREIAKIHATKMFEVAKERGDLDEFNVLRQDVIERIKGEIDE